MIQEFNYSSGSGTPKSISLSDSVVFAVRFEKNFKKPVMEALKTPSIDSILQLTYSMDINPETQRKSFEKYVEELDLPYSQLAALGETIANMFGAGDDDFENEDEEKNL